MTSPSSTQPNSAYLVQRINGRWREVHHLAPGHTVTVGRADTNRIVLEDTKCSRRHCEVAYEQGEWRLRDLESSNGTELNNVRITQTTELVEGDVIRVGNNELLFTREISGQLEQPEDLTDDEEPEKPFDFESTTEVEVIERRNRSAYNADPQAVARLRHGLASLYRVSSRMLGAADVKSLAEIAVDGLRENLKADLAAVLLFDTKTSRKGRVNELRIVAFRAPENSGFTRVSDRLSQQALEQKDGILALDLRQSSGSTEMQTLEAMKARNVICVPVRDDEQY